MHTVLKLPFIIFSCVYISQAYCQTKQNSSADLKKAISDIGGLFKKKKKDSVTAANPGIQPGAANGSTNYTTIAKPGGVAPNAKYIDADRIYSFNAGAAQIVKGTSSALIDSAGNYTLPYNTYKIMFVYYAGPVGYAVNYNGIYQYSNVDGNWGGYINAKGRVLLKTDLHTGVNEFTDNKMMVKVNNSSPKGVSYTYYAADGKVYNSAELIEHIVDGIGIVSVNSNGGYLHYYKKITGETISAAYADASPFSDGMARVGLPDNFGVLRYGFINTQGKLVIPCTFSEVPSDFSGGFARVQPKDRSAFEYAFINKKGEIVFKQTLADITKNGRFDHFTNFGLAFSDRNTIMDTSFSITTNAAFFQSFGLPADSWFSEPGSYTAGETNPKLVFATRLVRDAYTSMPVYGFINLATRKVVMPVFTFHNINGLYFDPVSHLAYAMVCTGKSNNGSPLYREGYINEDGMFVLVKGGPGQW